MLDDKADEAYHSPQRNAKRTVDVEGRGGRWGDEIEARLGRPTERPLARRDIDVKLGRVSEDRRVLRIALLRWVRRPRCGELFHSVVPLLLLC